MLKIVLIVKYYYPLKRPSGILRFVMNLSEKLGQKTNLTIITCRFEKKHKKIECYKNYKIIRVASPFYISSAIKAARLKPDLIIFGTGISKLWLLLITSSIFKFFNTVFSYTNDSSRPNYFLYQFVDINYKNHFLVKYVCTIFEKVICTNHSLYNFYSKQNNIKNKIFYIPPGIELSKFHNIKNKTNKNIRIGFFGHLSYNKGSDILLDSFLKLDDDNTELLLAGVGSLNHILKKKSRGHKNISIKGYINNIEMEILSCDILVFPYRKSEMILGLSLSAIEGIAMSKPLIVSDSNCLRDLVINGQNGYIFHSENELMEILKKLANDKKQITNFGIKSKTRSNEFNINIICDNLIDLLE
ncbi:MAG: glycosyltransferase family 4 protein [Candidatus Pacebacteria bacterium]|nr:glycosyltransferase family 4 protein [Candidatus Paceibacterota bacterium]